MGVNTSRSQPKPITFAHLSNKVKRRLANYPLHKTESQRKHASIQFESCLSQEVTCRILGCLFGCLIGDALGAFCEFQTSPLTEEHLEETMKMEGGGVFGLYRGQFTDDSQMAYHLLKALASLSPTESLQHQSYRILLEIANEYVYWSKSNPFDMGGTCKRGIGVLESLNAQGTQPEERVKKMLELVKGVNAESKSNGSLMRIAPMAILFAIIEEDPALYSQFIKDEIGLIHCNDVLKEAGYIWVKVLFHLIRRRDNEISTYKRIWKEAEDSAESEELKSWFTQAKEKKPMPAVENMGWAKIAWTYGMNILYRLTTNSIPKGISYYNEIKVVIGRGGDSDTNAAIVGGLLGAYLGFKQLPTNYLDVIFDLQFKERQFKLIDRPKHYQPINVLAELLQFIQIGQKYKKARPTTAVQQTRL